VVELNKNIGSSIFAKKNYMLYKMINIKITIEKIQQKLKLQPTRVKLWTYR
jgi:hypothetical protein